MERVTWRIKNIKTGEILDISKSVFKVGRNVHADITSLNSALSRNHATLSVLIDSCLYIQDHKSCNGTFVNNKKIPAMEMKLLNHGDIVGFGICQEMYGDEHSDLPLIFEVIKKEANISDPKSVKEENETVLQPHIAEFSKDFISDCIIISDGEDDDNMITNSQIFKLSEKIKSEQASFSESIDPYLHIKQELEDLDYSNNHQNIVDLTSDLDCFNSTRELISVLESPIHKNTGEEDGECSSSTTPVSKYVTNKSKYIKPPIIEPHSYSTIKCDEQSKSLEQNNTGVQEVTSKRKLVDASPTVGKKNKTSNNIVESRCDKKYIANEFIKRHKAKNIITRKIETGKKSKKMINTERRKKLKEITERDTNKFCDPVVKTHKATSKIKVSNGRGNFLLDRPSIPSTSKCLKKNLGTDQSIESKSEVSYQQTTHLKKDVKDKQIQDTTISSNFSPESDGNTFQKLNTHMSLNSVPKRTCNFQNLDCTQTNIPFININKSVTNIDDEICKIVHWPVKWLREQKNFDISPPVNGERQPVKMPVLYHSFADYFNIVTPLIMLELWQYVYQTLYNKDEERTPIRTFLCHKRIVGDLIYLDCECYIAKEDVTKNNIFRTDDLALIELKLKDAENSYIYNAFGYIKFSRRIDMRDDMIINNDIAELCPSIPHTNLKFTLVTRNLPDKDISGKQIVIKVIANIASYLKLIKTVKCVAESSIFKQVLRPSVEDYRISVDQDNLFVEVNLNSYQKKIVLEASSLCLRNDPGLYLIKGPPGTGKSTVIINIVLQVLFTNMDNCKTPPLILLTAPSNAAVDNLILKLAEVRTKLTDHQKKILKLIRIGPDSSISKNVNKFKLSSLAQNHILKENNLTTSEEYKHVLETCGDIQQFLRKKLGQRYFYEVKCAEDKLLHGSNVICTTLNSCVNPRIMDPCRRSQLRFSCCIVDEATQCNEIESLLPVQLGIDKIVLVGDPQQLPAVVCNKDAKKLGYGRSLFSRIDDNFKIKSDNPIRMLYEQYRMKSEICEYPNKTFYEGKLKSFPIHTNRIVPELKPYLLFNLMVIENQDKSVYQNSEEAQFIYNILHTLHNRIKSDCKYSIGIITPYRAQKDLLIRKISDIRFNINVSVTVNTIDSFQGMENDVVIISCVRYNPNYFLQNNQRLNVALTRARQALYIIGNYSLFKHCRLLYDLREDAKKRKLCYDIKEHSKNITDLHRLLEQ